jgi:hypothetical protein
VENAPIDGEACVCGVRPVNGKNPVTFTDISLFVWTGDRKSPSGCYDLSVPGS